MGFEKTKVEQALQIYSNPDHLMTFLTTYDDEDQKEEENGENVE
jgi:hypothetical protein